MFTLRKAGGEPNHRIAALVCSAPLIPGGLFLGLALGDGLVVAAGAALAAGTAGYAVIQRAVTHIDQHFATKTAKA